MRYPEIARHRDGIIRGGVQEHTTTMPPSDTTTAITAQANTQARAGALLAHHPAWVGHHTGGPGLNPTALPWVAHQQHISVTIQ